MAIGWILVSTNNSNSIEVEFSAANFGWPSSTKAEVLAILSTILVVSPHSKMKIYTDSKNAIQQFEQYKKELSVRRQLKINNQISWNTITYFLVKYNIDLELIKVKAHSDNWGNNEADRVVNKGLYDDYWIINDHLATSKYNIAWYNIKVKMGARKFTKLLNQTRRSLESENLKRIAKLSNIDKKISYKILNANRDNTSTGRQYLTFKENRRKAFKFKLMINELPTLEKLKMRYSDLYKKDLDCIRCNKKKEILSHIWEYSEVNNLIVMFELELKE